MRQFPPPLGLVAGFRDVIGQIVVAGHDGDRFGQRLEPGGELDGVVEPVVVLRRAVEDREGVFRIGLSYGVAEPLIAFVGPDVPAHAVEGEVAESLLDEIFGAHSSRLVMGPRDVGDGREAALEILGDGDDAFAGEKIHVGRVVELSDDGVGPHPVRPVDDRAHIRLVTYRERQPAEAPCLSGVVRVTCDT